ncbi:MFS transporter [Neobacillus drentensis]|uniref:MFS transporter n=1 Tax=Neobacillus drentensis TaxID=220684 RepID=UPI003002EE58
MEGVKIEDCQFKHSFFGVAITEIFKREVQARAKSILFVAQLIGSAITLYFTGLKADTWGWRVMFYNIGGVGLVVTLLLAKYYKPPKVIQTVQDCNNIPKILMKAMLM